VEIIRSGEEKNFLATKIVLACRKDLSKSEQWRVNRRIPASMHRKATFGSRIGLRPAESNPPFRETTAWSEESPYEPCENIASGRKRRLVAAK
jgi:hypothetical protein